MNLRREVDSSRIARAAFGGITHTAASRIAQAGLEIGNDPLGLTAWQTRGAKRCLDAPHSSGRSLGFGLGGLVGREQLVGVALLHGRAATNPGLGIHLLLYVL